MDAVSAVVAGTVKYAGKYLTIVLGHEADAPAVIADESGPKLTQIIWRSP